MKHLATLFVITAMLAAPVAHSQQADAVAQAQQAAQRWLALADANDGAASWEQASSSFRAVLSRADWSEALRRARQPFGAVTSRDLASSAFRTSLPGAPDGEYVVIEYHTRFEHKAQAVETVVPMRERDGSWKVSGYFVK